MRIGLIASPFIPVPPPAYGGTELFVANLARGLARRGFEVVVYANGASTIDTELRWKYPDADWPPSSELSGITKELDHLSWSMFDASENCDVIHVNSALGVTYSRFIDKQVVCTLHHPYEESLTRIYEQFPEVAYAAISHSQASFHPSLCLRTVHHGLDLELYHSKQHKQPYLCFLGRVCPIKGTHLAIEIAKRAGIPLKIAGEVQPIFRDYFDSQIKPHLDGRNVEFVGEADLAAKNELLGNSMGMLFPIQWEEPFGLVMIEAMACGTPVIAFPGGAVREVVANGVSGRICNDVEAAAECVKNEEFNAHAVRRWAEQNFSFEIMAQHYIDYYRDIVEDTDMVSSPASASQDAAVLSCLDASAEEAAA